MENTSGTLAHGTAQPPATRRGAAWLQGLYAYLARSLLLIPLFGTLLIAVLWLALTSRINTEREVTLASATRATESYAAAFSEYTLRELRDIDRTAWLVKAEVERYGVVDLPYLMRNSLVPAGGTIRVGVINSRGDVIATSGDLDSIRNVSDRDYFRLHAAADTGALDISQPITGRSSGQSEIKLTRRLNLADGSFGGVVILSVAPSYFAKFYRESQLGSHGMLAILGMDGVFRVRRSGDQIDAAFDGSASPMFEAAAAHAEGSYIRESVFDHARRLVAYRKLTEYPLIVAVAQAEDEVMADFAQRRSVYLVVGIIISIAIILFFSINTVLAYGARRSAIEVRRQKAFLQALVDNMPLGLIVRSARDPDSGRIKVWNPAAEIIFHRPAAEAMDRCIGDIFPSAYAASVEARDCAMLASPMVQDVLEVAADLAHQPNRVLHIVRAPIFDVDDKVEYVVSIIHDVTADQARTAELRLSAKVFETTADAIVLSDADDRVIAVNAAFTKMTGYHSDEMLDKRLVDSPFRPTDPGGYAARQAQLALDGCVTAEVLRRRKDGSLLPCWLTQTCVRDEDGATVNFVRVFTDISELKEAQRRLEELASYDALTGLLNRRMFHHHLDLALRRAGRSQRGVGLLFIDLDGFKKINDTHGHETGDAVLKEVAARLQRCVRATDTVCRLGGDEFTVIMEDATLPRDAITVSERIVAALATPADVAGESFACKTSIGIAFSPEHGQDAETLLHRADLAMYRAKQDGGHCFVIATASERAALRSPLPFPEIRRGGAQFR